MASGSVSGVDFISKLYSDHHQKTRKVFWNPKMDSGQPGFSKSSHLPSISPLFISPPISPLFINPEVQFTYQNGYTVRGNFITTQLYADHSYPSQFVCIVANGSQDRL
jgi:hypothetical protein